MKFFVILTLLLTSQSFAQETATQPSPVPAAQPVQAPVVSPEASPYSYVEKERKLRTAVFAYYSSGDQITFSSVTARSGSNSVTGTAAFSFDKALGLGFEAHDTAPSSWGYAIGMAYDFERKLNSGTATVSGVTATSVYIDPKPTLSIFNVYANAVYQFEKVYIPFGINISVPNMKTADGSVLTATGGIGAQVGIGAHINEKVSAELVSRAVSANVTRTVGNTSIDYGKGLIGGLQLQIKFGF